MGVRALISIPVLVAVALSLGAAGASADTLFTTASHTAPVSVGATASILSGTFTATGTSLGNPAHNQCTSSTLDLEIARNDGAGLVGTFTAGSFSGCILTPTGDFPWTFTVAGSGVVSGTSTVYADTTWHDLSFTGAAVSATGTLTGATGSPPADGVYARQLTSSGASICFVLDNAGTVAGPLLSEGRIHATYCLEGSGPNAWSLGSTAVPPLPPVTPGPATLFTTAVHATRVTVGATGRLAGQGLLGFTSGTSLASTCAASTLTFRLTQNSDASRVQGTVTSGQTLACSPFARAPTFPWTVSITGGRQDFAGNVAYPNTTLSNLRYDYGSGFGSGSGTLAPATSVTSNGLYAAQPTGAGAPICLVMNRAGTVTDALFGSQNLDGRFCFDDEPSRTWSLT
jgi:hypothetical protein